MEAGSDAAKGKTNGVLKGGEGNERGENESVLERQRVTENEINALGQAKIGLETGSRQISMLSENNSSTYYACLFICLALL